MAARTLTEIDADITRFTTALDELLLGTRPQAVEHGDRKISFGSNFSATKLALERKLRALAIERARVSGDPLPNRPYVPTGIARG